MSRPRHGRATARPAPVVLVTGELDIQLPPARAAEYAALFKHAELRVLSGAGHFPWRDDPGRVAEHTGARH